MQILGLVVVAIVAGYIVLAVFSPKTPMERVGQILNFEHLIPKDPEIAVKGKGGLYDRFSMHGERLQCIYVRRPGKYGSIESIDITVLQTGARLQAEFQNGRLASTEFKASRFLMSCLFGRGEMGSGDEREVPKNALEVIRSTVNIIDGGKLAAHN